MKYLKPFCSDFMIKSRVNKGVSLDPLEVAEEIKGFYERQGVNWESLRKSLLSALYWRFQARICWRLTLLHFTFG